MNDKRIISLTIRKKASKLSQILEIRRYSNLVKFHELIKTYKLSNMVIDY